MGRRAIVLFWGAVAAAVFFLGSVWTTAFVLGRAQRRARLSRSGEPIRMAGLKV